MKLFNEIFQNITTIIKLDLSLPKDNGLPTDTVSK